MAISRMPAAVVDDLGAEGDRLEQQVIRVGPAAAAFLDLGGIARDTTSRLARSLAFGA